ncbi:hypothetical protein [Streptomyces sp. MNP-20]|uniref:hypothetical protein n=1 Tax=Streptomyces sp. MNP-20 TaxID=2721165 RepID=UPI0015553C0A|nr:hypothetical protein [Streptomyces sp. MNP-20]
MSAHTLADQRSALTALTDLSTNFPGLPADSARVGRIFTRDSMAVGIAIALHEATSAAADDFRAWCAALNISAADVETRPAATTGMHYTTAEAHYAGVIVHLDCHTSRPFTLAPIAGGQRVPGW